MRSVAALRSLVGRRSLSASVDAAVAAHVARLRHPAAVDEWLAELDQAHGPVPEETLEMGGVAGRRLGVTACSCQPGPFGYQRVEPAGCDPCRFAAITPARSFGTPVVDVVGAVHGAGPVGCVMCVP